MSLPTLYIAGPMRGYPDHNFPAFRAAAAALRRAGYGVVNPAELHSGVLDLPWSEYLRRDLALLTSGAIGGIRKLVRMGLKMPKSMMKGKNSRLCPQACSACKKRSRSNQRDKRLK